MQIPMMGNTGTPDVLGALSGTPAGMMGGPMGMLANAPATGMGGLPPQGALSSGGISPQMIQLMLSGMKAGAGLTAGKKIQDIMGGVAQDLMPMAMMNAQQQQQAQGAPPPQGQGQIDQLVAMLKAKGLMGGPEGPMPPMPGMPPGGPPMPPAGMGMMRGYG